MVFIAYFVLSIIYLVGIAKVSMNEFFEDKNLVKRQIAINVWHRRFSHWLIVYLMNRRENVIDSGLKLFIVS